MSFDSVTSQLRHSQRPAEGARVQACAAAPVGSGALPAATINLLDRLLLVLMIVELLYTVQVSFREHTLVPEPFLIVGLVAAIRRILVLTAEFADLLQQGEAVVRVAMTELVLLTLMVLALVGSLRMLRGRHPAAVASKD